MALLRKTSGKNIGSRSRPDTVSRFPDVEYPEEMAHYPNVPLRIGLPNYHRRKHKRYSYSRRRLDNGYEKI